VHVTISVTSKTEGSRSEELEATRKNRHRLPLDDTTSVFPALRTDLVGSSPDTNDPMADQPLDYRLWANDLYLSLSLSRGERKTPAHIGRTGNEGSRHSAYSCGMQLFPEWSLRLVAWCGTRCSLHNVIVHMARAFQLLQQGRSVVAARSSSTQSWRRWLRFRAVTTNKPVFVGL